MIKLRQDLHDKLSFALRASSKEVALGFSTNSCDTSNEMWEAKIAYSSRYMQVVVSYDLHYYFDEIEKWPIEVIEDLSKLKWIPVRPKSPLKILAEAVDTDD